MQKILTETLASAPLLCVQVGLYHLDGDPEPTDDLRSLGAAHAAALPYLQYYCQKQEVCVNDAQGERRVLSQKLVWTRIKRVQNSPALEPMPNAAGESIHKYLQSPEFCRTLHFDGT